MQTINQVQVYNIQSIAKGDHDGNFVVTLSNWEQDVKVELYRDSLAINKRGAISDGRQINLNNRSIQMKFRIVNEVNVIKIDEQHTIETLSRDFSRCAMTFNINSTNGIKKLNSYKTVDKLIGELSKEIKSLLAEVNK